MRQRGFTIIELMLVVLIIGVLAAVALPAYRDQTVRAKMSEVIMAVIPCKLAVTDGWTRATTSPGAGAWGCESSVPTAAYVGKVQTTLNGEVRIQVRNLGSGFNGTYVYLKPYEVSPPPASGGGVFAPGLGVRAWRCGVDGADAASQELLKVLPASCRDSIEMSSTSWGP